MNQQLDLFKETETPADPAPFQPFRFLQPVWSAGTYELDEQEIPYRIPGLVQFRLQDPPDHFIVSHRIEDLPEPMRPDIGGIWKLVTYHRVNLTPA